ncbi:uncharacterized protein LOC129734063 [Wyeomyia smithii]|uniref:uncharacterized protein LOC129734063 n=1 Tax=Wyeomyia smithii TaxID=174621 RepID=UPI0024680A6B|nr:uncharacterized protein LOC129734063 [Wyeomyia smithii]
MSELSKCFYEATAGKTCRDLCHPEYASCWISFVESARLLLPGSFKLYLPYLVIPAIIKGGGYTRKYWRDSILGYCDLSFKTYVVAVCGLTFQCVFYKLFGELKYYWVMFFPGLFSTILSPKMSKVHQRLQGITYFNMMLEALIKQTNLSLVVALRDSKLLGTLLFMIFNARILDILQRVPVNHFWFAYPVKIKKGDVNSEDDSRVLGTIFPSAHKACSHERSCDMHILDGFLKYSLTGFIIELARFFFNKFPVLMKEPRKFLPEARRSLSMQLMFFFGSYIGAYRLIGCLLCRHFGEDRPINNQIAGFLGGLPYLIYPKYQVLTLAFTKFIEVEWDYYFKTAKKIPGWMRQLDRLPYLRIVLILGIAYLYHTIVFYPHLSPSFNRKVINYCSGNRVERLRRRLTGWMLQNEWNKA